MKKKLKVCFVASSGGHLEEISRLTEIEKSFDNFLITEKNLYNQLEFGKRRYYLPQINRKELMFIFKFIYIFFKSAKILLKEKPDYIISTGALCTYPVCMVGKIMKMKIIYIESFARCNEPSLTGKLIYNKADIFIVQWKNLIEYYQNAIYGGGIF